MSSQTVDRGELLKSTAMEADLSPASTRALGRRDICARILAGPTANVRTKISLGGFGN